MYKHFNEFRESFAHEIAELQRSIDSKDWHIDRLPYLTKLETLKTTLDVLEKYHLWMQIPHDGQ